MVQQQRKLTKSEIGDLGEALVVPRFIELLGWTARKDVPDHGYDYNVEVPAADGKPGRRFLVQVKTSETQMADRQRRWKLPVRTNALNRYRNSRHPVFLLGVCLTTRSIRWLDLSAEIRGNDGRGPFTLTENRQLDIAGLSLFQDAVDEAFEEADVDHVGATHLLERKVARMKAVDANLSVKIDVIDGKEIVSYGLLDGAPLRFSVKAADLDGVSRMTRSFDFGAKAELRVDSFALSGSPALSALNGGGMLTIMPTPVEVRLRLRSTRKRSKASIELDAKLTHGRKGVTFRTDDAQRVFGFTMVLNLEDGMATLTPEFTPEPWRECPVASLPMFEKVHALMTALRRRESFVIETYEYGEFCRPLSIRPLDTDALAAITEYLDFLSHLAYVCRYFKAPTIPWRNQSVSREQGLNIELAYRLSKLGTIDHVPGKMNLVLSDEAEQALHDAHADFTCGVDFHVMLPLRFGDDAIANIPVRQSIDRVTLRKLESGERMMEPVHDAKGRISLPGWKASDVVWSGAMDLEKL